MPNTAFIQDLAVVLLVAGFVALVFQRLKQPMVIGYILAGLLIGPHTPPFALIRDEATIRTLADLGVIFLMFSLGMEFNLRRIGKLGVTAGVAGFLDVAVMLWLGYLLGRRLGWPPVQSIFLGAIMCDSSTTILMKILHDTGRSRERFAHVAIGITIVEDLLAVVLLAVLTGLALTGAVQPGLVAARLWQLILFLVTVVVAGLLLIPRLLDRLARTNQDELLVVTLVGLCFGVSLIAARLELSMVLGAVLAGAIASESRAASRLAPLIDPLRHVFSAMFFVSVGLLLNPDIIVRHALPVLAVTALIVTGKVLANTTAALLTGHDLPFSLRVGSAMAQTGEFAFIIAALGLSLGALNAAVYQVGVSAAVLSTIISPYLIQFADRRAERIAACGACRRWAGFFGLYSAWAARALRHRGGGAVRRLVRRSLWVIAINTMLTAALIGAAGYVAQLRLPVLPGLPLGREAYALLAWLAAMVLSLPLYAVTVKKLEAMGMLFAEVALNANHGAAWARPARTLISNTVVLAGLLGLALLTFLLSSAVLPSRNLILLFMALLAAIALWSSRRLARLYNRARGSLEAVFAEEPSDRRGDAP